MPDKPARREPPGKKQSESMAAPRIQIKICGLTRLEDAQACIAAGVDAAGFVFYLPSPRNISPANARRITAVLPTAICPVGVFVDMDYDNIMHTSETAALRAIQLHGRESPALVERLRLSGLTVIKTLFLNAQPDFAAAAQYPASAFLVECAGGPLPGGNKQGWNWSEAQALATRFPTILAGGLDPTNVHTALRLAAPDAIDVSSGVEQRPGIKSALRVKALCQAAADWSPSRAPRPIFL
jgi:phosphoribosylanthranilate isomerase